MEFNEQALLEKYEKKAEYYTSKYEDVFDVVAQAPNFRKGVREFTNFDAYQLGQQLEMWKQYESWMTSEASGASDLGTIPNVAVDLISVAYATSIAPLLASIQSLGEQQGIVYYKTVQAVNTRQGITAGDDFANSTQGIVNSMYQYGSELIENEALGNTASGTTVYAFTALNLPIRSNINPTISVATLGYTGTFVNGVLLSQYALTGTIDYTTGAIALTFGADPAATYAVTMTYHQDFEKSDDIPQLEMVLTSTDVLAEVLALKMQISSLKAFQFNNRFGKVAEDDALQDLAGAMADIEGRKVISKLDALATTTGSAITFSKTKASGDSEYEHRQAFKYTLATGDTRINTNSGRGAANRYTAGHTASEYVASLPGFVKNPANIAVGPHVYGYLDNIPVIRTAYVDTDDILCSYLNPLSPFEAPVVCATYMPIFITNTMQVGNNPLQNQRAIASWKAFKGVVSQFVQRISLTS